MSSNRLFRNDHLVLIAIISTLVIASPSISNYGYFDITKVAYGQSDPNQMNSNTTSSVNIQDIPLKKVRVGDIDIAYKMFGKGEPILLISGAGGNMNSWDPSTLRSLSSNHTVIIFDNRGVANTTTGSKAFSIQQFANDTVGLLNVLKIQKADVLGHSMGGIIAQQLAVTHPEKVNRLILVSTTRGGKDSIPTSPQLLKLATEIENKLLNNIPITPQEIKLTMYASLGPAWIRLHPNSLDAIPKAGVPSQDLFPGVPVNTVMQQDKVVNNWKATNWIGICDELSKISNPTLIITGTDDGAIQPANSLIIAGKIPGAWLVHIKDAGHQLMSQYPNKFNKVLQTFLSTTN
ncbi:MAG TPA: alpha/beta hydrolase [Candidatus Eisenbacteria bacterium]|nr:alpha/beta hydrolase [Candidatus Eisenbacteria bacterium]